VSPPKGLEQPEKSRNGSNKTNNVIKTVFIRVISAMFIPMNRVQSAKCRVQRKKHLKNHGLRKNAFNPQYLILNTQLASFYTRPYLPIL
jgi:hypothetical protein